MNNGSNDDKTKELGRQQLRWMLMASSFNTGAFIIIYGLGLLSVLSLEDMPFEEFEAMLMARMQGLADEDTLRGMQGMLAVLYHHGVALMSILLGRTVLRLYGVLQMFKGRKQGFHIYAFAQLAGLFAPHLVLPWAYLGLWGPLATVGLTALYGLYIRHLDQEPAPQ